MTTVRRQAVAGGGGEAGSALIEVTWLAILLMVPLVYVLISVFDVQRGAFGVSAASRSAARAYALAGSDAEGRAQARSAARVALADQGVDDDFDLDISCTPLPRSCLSPGSVITVVVRTQVDLPLAPSALGGGAPSFRVDSTHRVPYGSYVEER
ncbi:hypothetical protein EKO23_21400 [Nocardioides guangzhouensis]|uniref:Pilus assembly protein n=1 Tax=Nocardioides guangzhouensis TaxID=2497878 RepID=A0A4Q4Z6C5_9ACTN|nr:hypothetical protein [Nocardioides guangzhouensis]RYP82641.1 hypothetical protein EKO23_21400 [Nocardioides guangzhouensis]